MCYVLKLPKKSTREKIKNHKKNNKINNKKKKNYILYKIIIKIFFIKKICDFRF